MYESEDSISDPDPDNSEDDFEDPKFVNWFQPNKGQSFKKAFKKKEWESIVNRAAKAYERGHTYWPDWMVSYLANCQWMRRRWRIKKWCHACHQGDFQHDKLIKCKGRATCKNHTHHAYECSKSLDFGRDLPSKEWAEKKWVCWECMFKDKATKAHSEGKETQAFLQGKRTRREERRRAREEEEQQTQAPAQGQKRARDTQHASGPSAKRQKKRAPAVEISDEANGDVDEAEETRDAVDGAANHGLNSGINDDVNGADIDDWENEADFGY